MDIRRTWLLVVGCGALALPGCGSLLGDCPEKPACVGSDSRKVCTASDPPKMEVESCGAATCVDTKSGPICSESATPVAECQQPPHPLVGAADTVCYQNEAVLCAEGYPYGPHPCSGSCVDTVPCGAVCVSAPQPEHPACTQPGVPSLCLDNVVVTCGCGAAPDEEVCPVACAFAPQDVDPAEAFCALSAKPDARCPDIRGGGAEDDNTFCDGNKKVQCHRKFAISVTECQTCEKAPYGGVLCDGA